MMKACKVHRKLTKKTSIKAFNISMQIMFRTSTYTMPELYFYHILQHIWQVKDPDDALAFWPHLGPHLRSQGQVYKNLSLRPRQETLRSTVAWSTEIRELSSLTIQISQKSSMTIIWEFKHIWVLHWTS